MPRVFNQKKAITDPIPANAVLIMRPTKWGNPHPVGRFCWHCDSWHTRKEAVRAFRDGLTEEFIAEIRAELKGKDLVCTCAPLECHGDVLLVIANGAD